MPPIGMATLSDPRHETFLQWLTTAPRERELKTLDQVGASLGVARRTLHDWKQRPEFRREWDERAVAIAGDPERTQRVLDALYEQATDGESAKQVQAARAWADIAGVIKPPKKVESSVGNAREIPREDLDRMILELLEARDGAAVK